MCIWDNLGVGLEAARNKIIERLREIVINYKPEDYEIDDYHVVHTIMPNHQTRIHDGVEVLGVKFGKVGDFVCSKKLKTLKGTPRECHLFDLSDNMYIDSLNGGPKEITNIRVSRSNISDLSGMPSLVHCLDCSGCKKLTSLKGVCCANSIRLDGSAIETLDNILEVKTVNARDCESLRSIAGIPASCTDIYLTSSNKNRTDVRNIDLSSARPHTIIH